MKKLISLAFVGVALFPMLSHAQEAPQTLTKEEIIAEIQAQLVVLYQKLIEVLTAQLEAKLAAPVQKIEQHTQQITDIQTTQQAQAAQIAQIQSNVGTPAGAVNPVTPPVVVSEKDQKIAALKQKLNQDIYDVQHSIGSNTTFVQAAIYALTQKYNSDLEIIQDGIIIPPLIVPPAVTINQPVCISTTTSQWSLGVDDWSKTPKIRMYFTGDLLRPFTASNGDNYATPATVFVQSDDKASQYGQLDYTLGHGTIRYIMWAYKPDYLTTGGSYYTPWQQNNFIVPDCNNFGN